MRYRIEKVPNPDCLIIHFDTELPRGSAEFGLFFDGLNPLDEEDSDLLRSLADCRGVTSVSLSKYVVHLVKSPIFSWDAITAEVLEIIRKRFVPNGVLEPC